MTTKTYLVVYEKSLENWSGYSPQVWDVFPPVTRLKKRAP